jgi:antitoxin CptB
MDQERIRKLRYRAWRRGFKEIDLIIGHFVDRNAQALSNEELDELELLMAEQDQDLYAYIIGTQTPPDALAKLPMLKRLSDFSKLAEDIEAASGQKGFGE